MTVQKTRGRAKVRHAAERGPRGTLFALVSHLMRLQLKSVLIWGFAIGLYSAAMAASFTTFAGDADQLNQLLDAYPEGMLDAFGITDLGQVENYMNSQVFLLAPLALAFFTILALAGALAGAEERGAIDVLLGNPLPRWQLVLGNFLATALSLAGIVAIVGALTWGTAVLMDIDLSLEDTAAAVFNLWPICLFFGSVALLCSAAFHRRALAVAIPAFLLFAMYLLDVMGRVSEDLEYLQPYSVFYYYGSAIEDGIDWANFGGVTAVAVVFALLAVLVFRRRDIYT